MNEKLDLAQILKDCPKGMELDCVLFNGAATFNGIVNDGQYPIEIKIDDNYREYLDKYGSYFGRPYCKCVIFPKGKTTWEGFQRPFVDGDVVYAKVDDLSYVIIYHKQIDESVYCHACLCLETDGYCCDKDCFFTDSPIDEWHLATEEEKAKLFQVIKDKGYQWNPETKTLEKLIVPKFNVGDKIRHKTANRDYILEISKLYNDSYGLVGCSWMIPMEYQNEYELVPNKFDPKTLQPFDKVLVTDSLHNVWYAGFFSHINESKDYPFAVGIGHYRYCIPYNDDTKHLAGKSGEVPKFYRYWEE